MKSRSKFTLTLLNLAIPGLMVVALLNRQHIYDWYLLQGYEPKPEIARLATDTKMSEYARKLFYINKPQLLDSDTFNQRCTDSEETIVLGCYDGSGIYIFDVNDPRLEGIEQVTAAHEMLHVGYERLSERDRTDLNNLLEKQFKKITDQRILKNIETYRKKDPTVIYNEMHSIFGTEVATLEPELETYYLQDFLNRKEVVELSVSYEKIFTDLKNRVEDLDTKLANLKQQIDTLESELKTEADRLSGWSDRLTQLRNSGDVSDYNSQVNSYNSAVYSYRAKLSQEKTLIDQYNSIVTERNNLALQQNNLYQSIDSNSRKL